MGKTAPSRAGFKNLLMCHEVASGPVSDSPSRGSERSGFRFAITHRRGNDQLWIVESGATGVGEHIAELSAFMNRSWRFRSAVAADSAGERELLEELAQAVNVLAFLGINLRICPLQIRWTQDPRRAVTRAGEKNHVEIVLFDQPIQMNIHERQART